MPPHILIVEDEPDIQRLLEINLTREGYRVTVCGSGKLAWEKLSASLPDLVLLDLMLPDLSGVELCRRARADARLAELPILMLTARGDEIDRVVGFSVGADDYVTKPFLIRELLLRVRAILRRRAAAPADEDRLDAGALSVDAAVGKAWVAGAEVPLTPQELRLVALMMRQRGRVVTRETLRAQVWGDDDPVSLSAVESSVKRLRRKLGAAGDNIETLRGVGYRLRAEG